MAEMVFKQLKSRLSFTIMLVLGLVLAFIFVVFNLLVEGSNTMVALDFIQNLEAAESEFEYHYSQHIPTTEQNLLHEMYGDSDLFFEYSGITDIENRTKGNNQGEIIPFNGDIYDGFRNYYMTRVDFSGNQIKVISDFSSDYDEEYIAEIVKDITERKKVSDTYKIYTYKKYPRDYGYLVILLDRGVELNQEKNFAFVSLIMYGIGLLISYAISWSIALKIIQPVEDAFNRQKQFIADASHELKTPIAVIGANIDVLQQEIPDNKWLQYIKMENTRMSSLVKDMLYLAKNDAGVEKINMHQFDLVSCVNFAALPFESVAFEQGKKLEVMLPEKQIPVTADESKIKQAIIILIDNALKNSEKNSLIRVSARNDEKNAVVSVYNTGRGIAEEEQKKIFNRFYRVDSSRDRSTGGYGLGLSIAQTIAVQHGGKITINSVYGHYAEFNLILPMKIK